MAITPLTKKRVIYSDFDKQLTQHPVSEDIARKTNENAVKESIKNLVLTDRGERPYQPNLGCDVRQLLFEPFTEQTRSAIKTLITQTIENYETRANLIGVDVYGDIDSNELNVSIVFNVINNEEPVTLEFVLNRIR